MVEAIVLEVDDVSIYKYTKLVWSAAKQVDANGKEWSLKLRHFVASQLIKAVIWEAYSHNIPTRIQQWCYWHLINQLEFTIYADKIAKKKKWEYNISEQADRSKNAADVAEQARQRRLRGGGAAPVRALPAATALAVSA
jgi:hypothetical protein